MIDTDTAVAKAFRAAIVAIAEVIASGRRDHTPTTPEVARDIDRSVDAAVVRMLGAVSLAGITPDQWPRPDQGRLHDQTSLDAITDRGGVPVGRDVAEIFRTYSKPAPEALKNPCRCDLEEITHGPFRRRGKDWPALGNRCYKSVYRKGEYPTRRC